MHICLKTLQEGYQPAQTLCASRHNRIDLQPIRAEKRTWPTHCCWVTMSDTCMLGQCLVRFEAGKTWLPGHKQSQITVTHFWKYVKQKQFYSLSWYYWAGAPTTNQINRTCNILHFILAWQCLGNKSEYERDQTHLLERMKHELRRFDWFPG